MASAAKTTNDELLMRLRSAGDSSEVMARLWENNQGLIRMIVHNVTGLTEREEGFEDMVQQSYFGFASAAESYDPASGVEFSTYAANRVKWSLCRYYERNGYTVRVPAYMRRRIRDCAERKRQMEAETGRILMRLWGVTISRSWMVMRSRRCCRDAGGVSKAGDGEHGKLRGR